MNSRVERMFGARESWGKGNERERVEAGKTARSKRDTPSTALRSPSPFGGDKGLDHRKMVPSAAMASWRKIRAKSGLCKWFSMATTICWGFRLGFWAQTRH